MKTYENSKRESSFYAYFAFFADKEKKKLLKAKRTEEIRFMLQATL